MNIEEEIVVKTIWSEMVKSFHPTPPHLNTFKLSIFDQIFPLFHNSTILFYGSSSSFRDPDNLMTMLKASLSKTLCQFYPFAGRLIDDSTIVCNDKGVLLTHAQVTCSLKTYLSLITTTSSMNHLSKLLPSNESLYGSHQHQPIPISAWLQLAFQVNVFECGGVVLGCTKNHKLMDLTSLVTFLQHWAGLCLGLDPEYLIQPNFDVVVTTFPPNNSGYPPPTTIKAQEFFKEQMRKAYANNSTSTFTCKVFLFKAAAISGLRSINRTRVESILGFLWKHCARAEENKDQNCPTGIVLTTNIRSMCHPPLPRESMGNIGTNVVARAEKNGSGFAELVSGAIHELRSGKLVREIDGEALSKHKYMYAKEMFKPSTYRVSCLCKLGITDVDFGLGKPVLVCPFNGIVIPALKNLIYLMDHGNNGIMAWLLLDEKHMHNLETNPDFLAFASPFDPDSLF